jgi:type II secretory pathway pseudopilin PulG
VIAIIGVLVALLLPAVQSAREASRRTNCTNNIRQLGLACHNFADVNGCFPDGVQIANPPINSTTNMLSVFRSPGFGPNWAVLMLPFYEQKSLYDSQAGSIDSFKGSNGSNQNWRNVRTQRLATFRCPSDPGYQFAFARDGGNWARGNYGANAGPGWLNFTIGGKSFDGGATDTSSTGQAANALVGGPFGVNYGCRLTELTQQDGTSSTILLNELRTGLNDQDRRGVWAMGVSGSSLTAAHAIGDALIPNDTTEFSDDIENCNDTRVKAGVPATTGLGPKRMGCSNDNMPNNWPNWQAQSRSLHPSGVQACFGDCSVKTIPNTVAQSIWRLLNSRNDGQAIPSYD